ncbi:MAG: M12 family metallo-peptidase [Verrucomicrobiota bacterium]|nr:M12 family metallo-peptidase [Verrucomicrobiota bacterium]
MSKNKYRLIISVVGVLLLVLAFSGGSSAREVRPIVISSNADASVRVSRPAPEGQEDDALRPVRPGAGIKEKAEKIKINQSTLDRIAFGNDRVVQVSLFDGEVVNVGIDQRTPNGPEGAMLVYGKVKGDPHSRVWFSVYKHAMFASLRLGDGREFKIESLPHGKYGFELFESNTSISLRHQFRPGVPEPEMFHVINGEKVRLMHCYATPVPKSLLPPKRMLGLDAWRPEVKVIAMESGVAERVKLRMPLGKTGTSTENSVVPRPPVFAGRHAEGKGGNETTAAANGTSARTPIGWLPPPRNPQQQQQQQQQGSQQQQQGGGGTVITVGIIYTPKAEAGLGDAAKVQAKAGTLFAGWNTALKDSGTGASGVQGGKVFKISKDFDTTQMGECLTWMRTDKESTDWRDANKADLMTCIMEGKPGGGSVGLGAVLQTTKGNKGTFYNCMWHNYGETTFAHELGHNMGLGHDPTQGSKGIDAWSWGNHFTAENTGYCTVQAYGKSGFTANALIYSGPNSKYKGVVTGETDKIDAVRTIKEVMGPISKYY